MVRYLIAVGVVCMFVMPTVSFGATTSQLGEGHVLPLSIKDNLFAFVFSPKTWEDIVLGDGSGIAVLETRFPDTSIGGSIDIDLYNKAENSWSKNKSNSWIVKNYIQDNIVDALEITNVKRGKVTVDGVTANYIRYTYDTSTYLIAVYTKSGKVYMFNAQTPNAFWKANEHALEQTLSTFHTGKLNHLR